MAIHTDDIGSLLRCPVSGSVLTHRNGAFVSPRHPDAMFPIEDGIVRAYIEPETSAPGDVSDAMRTFYEATPFPNYDDIESAGTLIEKSKERGFADALNRSIPPHATVLEVGCGTGQLGNFLSIAQRRVLSTDMCMNSLRLGQRFKTEQGLRSITFAHANLFRLPLQPGVFDAVICTGVLHHTSDPFQGFRGLTPLVKPGGHIIIGLYNRFGRLKTRLRRMLFQRFGERAANMDPLLKQFGLSGDKRRAWIQDQYNNPHESLHTYGEVLGWFKKEGITFVRAIPSAVYGSEFEPEYRQSLFEPQPHGTHADRLLAQMSMMLHDTEGGLFIMIGKRE